MYLAICVASLSTIPDSSVLLLHSRLVREVEELQASVAVLRSKLAEAEASHQKLLRTKAELEADIAIKEQSMFIDR